MDTEPQDTTDQKERGRDAMRADEALHMLQQVHETLSWGLSEVLESDDTLRPYLLFWKGQISHALSRLDPDWEEEATGSALSPPENVTGERDGSLKPGQAVNVEADTYEGPGVVSTDTYYDSHLVHLGSNIRGEDRGLHVAVRIPNDNVHLYPIDSVTLEAPTSP